MPRYATVTPQLSVEELAVRYRQAHDPVARSHWQIVWLVAQGHHVPEVAQLVGYSANWVRAIIRRFNAGGPEALVDQRTAHRGGNPPLLTPALRDALADALDGPAPDGGVWTCGKVAAWMAARSPRLGGGRRCERSASVSSARGRGPPRPIPMRRRPSKKGPSGTGGCGPRRPSRGHADPVGDGRAPPWAAAGHAPGLGQARAAPHRLGPSPLPLAVRRWLRPAPHRPELVGAGPDGHHSGDGHGPRRLRRGRRDRRAAPGGAGPRRGGLAHVETAGRARGHRCGLPPARRPRAPAG